MRFTIRILVFAAFAIIGATIGCGPRDTTPKAVDVKQDPRVQPQGMNDGKKVSGTQGEAPK